MNKDLYRFLSKQGAKAVVTPRKPKHIESRLQQDCVHWFNLQYPHYRGLLFAVGNGGKRSVIEAKIMKSEGVVAGVSDLILILPRRKHNILCIEMKTEKGRQSDRQKQWQELLDNLSKSETTPPLYKIVRSFEEFEKLIKWYLNER